MARRLQSRLQKKQKITPKEEVTPTPNGGYSTPPQSPRTIRNGSHVNYSKLMSPSRDDEEQDKRIGISDIDDSTGSGSGSSCVNILEEGKVRRSQSCSDLQTPHYVITNAQDSMKIILKSALKKYNSDTIIEELPNSFHETGILSSLTSKFKKENDSNISYNHYRSMNDEGILVSKPKKRVRFADIEEYQIKEDQNEILENHISKVMTSYDQLFYGSSHVEEYTNFLPPLPEIDKHILPKNTAIITVGGERGFLFKHMVFNVSVSNQLDPLSVEDFNICNVQRRYNDFVWLWEFIVKKYPLRQVPSLPRKRGLVLADSKKRFDPDFIEARREGLQSFLIELLFHPTFSKDIAVQVFIQCEDQASFDRSKDMLLKTMQIEKDLISNNST